MSSGSFPPLPPDEKPMKTRAFTLVELLVVVAIIALLVSILLPSLSLAKELTRKVTCKTNIRLLQLGNEFYQAENNGWYVPGAADFVANENRWFGSRSGSTGPFVADDGPLAPYLPGSAVRCCPSFKEYLTSFEAGCGGYGYNNNFVGQYRKAPDYSMKTDLTGNRAEAFASTSETVAFTDAAFVDGGLIEYSFCESPRWPDWDAKPRPSIHFRHVGAVNVVWLDTHVTEETMAFSGNAASDYYEGVPADFGVGWFGPDSNELFDLE